MEIVNLVEATLLIKTGRTKSSAKTSIVFGQTSLMQIVLADLTQ